MTQISFGRCVRITVAFVLTLLCITGSSILHAQQSGSLSGTVLDPGGSALPHATIVIARQSGNFSRTVTSDAQGNFSLTGLPAGSYNIDVTLQG